MICLEAYLEDSWITSQRCLESLTPIILAILPKINLFPVYPSVLLQFMSDF